MSTPKQSTGFLLGMCLAMLGANVVWVGYNNVLLPTLVERIIVEGRGLAVGLIGFFGTLVGIFISLLSGILSDHAASRFGRRVPGLVIGSALCLPVIGLSALFYPPAMPVIVVSYIGMQFFTNVVNGAWWPLLVDLVPENQRGLASGFNGLFTMLGAVIAILGVTLLNENGRTDLALWLVGGIFAVTGIATALVVRKQDRPAPAGESLNLFKGIAQIFRVRTRVSVFFWVVFSALLVNMGFNSLQYFARYFFEVYFPAVNPDYAFRFMGGINLVVTMLSAVLAGFLSDRIGRRKLILWAAFLSGLFSLLMGLTADFYLFLAFAGLRSLATGPIITVIPALASDISPKKEAGQYMAYNNLSTGLSGALASLIFGVILVDMSKTGFMALFIVSAVFFCAGGLIFGLRVPQKKIDERLRCDETPVVRTT